MKRRDLCALMLALVSVAALEHTALGASLYWAEAGKIRRAQLDGSGAQDVVACFPEGIALDVGGNKMYWTRDVADLKVPAVQRANTDGLEEVLLAESWRDVRQRVEARVIQEVRQFINKESQSIAGFPAADVDSFRQAARLAVQNRVRQEVAKLVVNFTGSGLVIQFAQEVVIEWLGDTLWPKLREAFRPKGNIEGRLTQSLATLEASRRELNALGSGAGGAAKVELREVQATVDRAWVRLAATRYLERDIKKSGGDEPYGRLLDAKLGLLRTIDLAEHRFMLAKAARIAALASQSRLLDESLKTLRASVPKLGT